MAQQTPKILVITGPTASGKSSLAIEIAQRYNGEIISADSRQIYRGMDIGTGKVTLEEQARVPHHLLDIREPSEDYNVTDFIRDAQAVIKDIHSRGKLPIICGGTVFWIQALIDGQQFPAVPPDPKLREELDRLPLKKLVTMLSKLDPERVETIDTKNPVRLIRAIEIARSGVIQPTLHSRTDALPATIIALCSPLDELKARIQERLDARFDQGMIQEVEQLHVAGISWEHLEQFGLEYRFIAQFLQDKIDEEAMKEQLYFAIVHYAKRQLTWLRRWERQGTEVVQFTTDKDVLRFLEKERP